MAKQETANNEATAAPVIKPSEVSKITLTTFRPKRIGGQDDSVYKLVLGYLIGKGVDLTEAQSPDKSQTFVGLKGRFEARIIDASGNLEELIVSGKAFISSPFGDKFIEALSTLSDNQGVVTREAAESVSFAYVIAVERANNPAGYSWVLEPMIDDKAEYDPLADLRLLLPQTVAPKALPKPDAA